MGNRATGKPSVGKKFLAALKGTKEAVWPVLGINEEAYFCEEN